MRIQFRTDRALELSGFDAKLRASCSAESVETTIPSITASNTASSEQLTQVHSNEAVETTISYITASNTASSEQMTQVHSNGGNFTLQDGDSLYISSPNYPANYDSNTDVLWVINMPEDCSLVLSLLSFNTEDYLDQLTVSSESEADQSVVVMSRFSSRLGPYNRTYAPSTLMRIQFRTDRTLELSGFYAKLRASCSAESVETTIPSITASNTASSEQMTQVHSNGGNFALQDGDSLYISSPNYPANYDSNANVLWVITMPEDCSLVLSVLSFFTENSYDQLTVSSESGADQSVMLNDRFTSHLAQFNKTYAPSTLMRIRFRTDRTLELSGFYAKLRASCSAESVETTISSITASNTASSEQLTQVHSNGGHFALQDGDSLYISSPNYPANYDSYADVLWVITMPEDCSLVLSVLSFNTESFYDALTVSSESGADQSVVLIDTLSSRLEPFNRTYAPSTLMRIIFRTDSTVEYKGFEAELRASCSAETTTASQTTGLTTQDYNDLTSEVPWTIGVNVDSTGGPIALREGQDYFIASSSFPSNYPSNATILWQVTTSDRCAIHITFMAFSTEPIYDYLVVGSQDVTPKNMVHRWTGEEIPAPLHLNSNQVWFLFISDSETEEQGFVAKLQAMCSNSTGRKENFDEKLNTVARKVGRRDEIDDLGKALGFELEDIQRYVDTNVKYSDVSYMGTLSMLRKWRKKQTEATECQALKGALREAGQIRLADELFVEGRTWTVPHFDPKKKRKHNWWFRPMLHPQLRAERGQYHTLMEELSENDRRKFKNYTRVSPEMFDDLLLSVFLRHLANGATYAELSFNFRMGKETIQKFVPDVARAVVDEYAAEVI
eukprot:XP_011676156.1 PREDICTED: CUB and sushi domain-containing protein 1-like [Strongylocentrotus purpuratus]